MMCIDEMTDAEKAWQIVKKIDELKNLLWEQYSKEFTREQSAESSKSIEPVLF
jgi:hypothetical protein